MLSSLIRSTLRGVDQDATIGSLKSALDEAERKHRGLQRLLEKERLRVDVSGKRVCCAQSTPSGRLGGAHAAGRCPMRVGRPWCLGASAHVVVSF